MKATRPHGVAEVRSFLGLISYHHRLLPNLSTARSASPELTLGEEPQLEMDKKLRRSIPQRVRSFRASSNYDLRLPLLFACDASPVGTGAVFSSVISDGTKPPIAFASRQLKKTEQKYAQIDD